MPLFDDRTECPGPSTGKAAPRRIESKNINLATDIHHDLAEHKDISHRSNRNDNNYSSSNNNRCGEP